MMILTPPLSSKLSSVCKRICELEGWNVSNLRLQKLLYLCHMIYMGRHRKPLVQENFEAWMYGPVVPQLYKKMKVFGSSPVGDRFYNATPLSPDEEIIISEVCESLRQYSDSALVSITHAPDGAWSKHYDSAEMGTIIKSEDIMDEYQLRTTK